MLIMVALTFPRMVRASGVFGPIRRVSAGNVGGRSQCDSWDPGRLRRRDRDGRAGCGGWRGYANGPRDANGAPPSMSRRGPTRPRRAGAAGCPASWRSATVRPVWKQQLKSRLPGFPVARVSPAFREFPPGRTSALAVTEFVLWAGELAQGFPASNFKIFPGYPRNPQESPCYPPGKVTVHRGFHRAGPQAVLAGSRARSGAWAGSWSGRELRGPGPGARRARSWPGGGIGAGMPYAATRPLHV